MRLQQHGNRVKILVLPGCILAAALPSAHATVQAQQIVEAPPILYFPSANSRPTYFTVHDIAEAWAVTRGRGVKIGILDHSFGFRVHPGLYAGGERFQADRWGEAFDSISHHGYWMASTLHELAPESEIYALGTYTSDEAAKVDGMVRAIDWAIDHGLDVLTYSAERFPPEQRARLDAAVERAHAHGIATTFIHYPHPGNILPTWLGPRSGDDEREPDLNILQYDYSVIFTERYADWMVKGKESGYQPFLSISSTSVVAAAFVAMLKSVCSDLRPAEARRVLMETSHETMFEGMKSPRTVDIGAAVKRVMSGTPPWEGCRAR